MTISSVLCSPVPCVCALFFHVAIFWLLWQAVASCGNFDFRKCNGYFWLYRHFPGIFHRTDEISLRIKNSTYDWWIFNCIFFSKNFVIMFCFFFPRKSLKSTHSLKFRTGKKKTARKKKQVFTHSIEFCRKNPKNKLLIGNKKNGKGKSRQRAGFKIH